MAVFELYQSGFLNDDMSPIYDKYVQYFGIKF
jgi:hypothetical protein